MTIEFIFVYGTLRRRASGCMSELLANRCEYYSVGCIQGRLYKVGDYPGAIESPDPDDKVIGDLYRIEEDGDVLSRLDEYEECTGQDSEPHEYKRKTTKVSLCGGERVEAWVYLYNRDISGLQRIKSGDYLAESF